MERPGRWDSAFDPDMTEANLAMLMERPEISAIDALRFPRSVPLEGIIKNDCRLVKFKPGEIIIREGDYGNSAFLVISGKATVVIKPSLPSHLLGRSNPKKKTFWKVLSQLWGNSNVPEGRNTELYIDKSTGLQKDDKTEHASLFSVRDHQQIFKEPLQNISDIKEVPSLKDIYDVVEFKSGKIFGEIAALGRVQRTSTIFAKKETVLLEIRWQGLRDIRKYDDGWRHIIDESYRNNVLKGHLREHPIFQELDEDALQRVANNTLFETYGSFEWYLTYSKSSDTLNKDENDVVVKQGDYADGLLLIAGGFGGVTMKVGSGERTLTYLRQGDYFGLDELYTSWKNDQETPLETSLMTLGYIHVLRVSTHILSELVFPSMSEPKSRLSDAAKRPLANDALLEWAVENHFINGTQAMLINLDKCVRCDDCVTACSNSHDGNPRFTRQGQTHGASMVANACMHCLDPVCMIGCPTGAIHRSQGGGNVIINDITCIGCGTCSNACPYNNIKMVEIHDQNGLSILDPKTQQPILKATKCDLCIDQLGGPACVNACPHDALQRVDFGDQNIFNKQFNQ